MNKKTIQRWGILAILIVTVIGTMGSFAVMVLSSQDQSAQQKSYNELLAKYQKDQAEYEKKVTAQGDELSKTYYEAFTPYSSQVGSFAIDSVKDLEKQDLVVGDGEEVTGTTKFAAYYIGWDANGHVFDQSIDTANAKLKAPLPIATGLDTASLIAGWKEGMIGMHIGGVRLLTIPSDKAYGEAGQGTSIAPNMPLKFVILAIPAQAEIAQPDTAELMKYMNQTGA